MRSFALLSIAATLASLGVQASPLDVRANAEFDNNKRIPALNAPSQGVQNEHGPSGRRGAAAAEVDVCANVAVDMLARQGSAADAIIAASLCVGSVNAFHSGIGGGGFILARSSNGTVEEIDMRETMPAAGNETMFRNASSTVGGLAVGVPGEIRGWQALHARHGRLPWSALFEPAIQINRYGFKVPSQLGVAIQQYKSSFICQDPLWAETYCANGTAAAEGDVIKRERYADSLEIIAKKGADAFYTGRMAVTTAAAAQARGGILTVQDLANYTVIIRKPAEISFRGRRVYSTVAPSSGSVILSTLATMDQFGPEDVGYNLTTHRLIEATKWAYAERATLADPAFVSNVTELEQRHLTQASAAARRAKINDTRTYEPSYYNPSNLEILTDGGTSHLAVIDSDGAAVTLTTTVNLFWGSQVMTSDGIILNDEMDDFSSPGAANAFGYAPASANFIRPGKRPLSSISPVIAINEKTGKIELASGSAGGSRIVTANIINTYNVLALNYTLQDSLALPRWHDQLVPATTVLEWADSFPKIPNWQGFSNSTAAYLQGLGHNISYVTPGSSSAQGVQRSKNGLLTGAHETRQLSAGAAAI